jgi:membrane associated rhomboid family serine protease
MLASISPVGEAARGQRWPVTVTAYLVASTLGGGIVGALAGGLGQAAFAVTGRPSAAASVAALAVLAALVLAVDRGRVSWRVPSWQRQVDERWLTTYRGWVYGAGFGFQLGAGVLTRIATAAVYLLLAAAAATGSLTTGALLGAFFGTVRALPILLARRHRDPASLNAFHQRMDAAAPTADRVTSAVVALATAVLATTAVAG